MGKRETGMSQVKFLCLLMSVIFISIFHIAFVFNFMILLGYICFLFKLDGIIEF